MSEDAQYVFAGQNDETGAVDIFSIFGQGGVVIRPKEYQFEHTTVYGVDLYNRHEREYDEIPERDIKDIRISLTFETVESLDILLANLDVIRNHMIKEQSEDV